jgi:acyl-CoA synthetase (AMP-forming)/AMP-acid ligase II
VTKPIDVGGERVFPDEVEAVLRYHPGVADAAVVGVDDRVTGQRLVAVIQAAGDVAPGLEELTRFSRGRLVGYRMPRSLVVVDAIRRLDSGRPDYDWARSVAATAPAPSAEATSRQPT